MLCRPRASCTCSYIYLLVYLFYGQRRLLARKTKKKKIKSCFNQRMHTHTLIHTHSHLLVTSFQERGKKAALFFFFSQVKKEIKKKKTTTQYRQRRNRGERSVPFPSSYFLQLTSFFFFSLFLLLALVWLYNPETPSFPLFPSNPLPPPPHTRFLVRGHKNTVVGNGSLSCTFQGT